jgi:hypothetical protein
MHVGLLHNPDVLMQGVCRHSFLHGCPHGSRIGSSISTQQQSCAWVEASWAGMLFNECHASDRNPHLEAC